MAKFEKTKRVSTGVQGLDSILYGGLPRNRFSVVQGAPGTGKTTLALQYLLEGARRGERTLFVTLAQTEQELRRAARAYGFSLAGVKVHALEPTDIMTRLGRQQDVLPMNEVELGEVGDLISGIVADVKPERLVFDSVGDVRLLSDNAYVYRQQIIALRHFLEALECTSLFTDILEISHTDTDLQALADGVIRLERTTPLYGDKRYRLQVLKMRGMDFHGGFHDYSIRANGVEVYPRVVVTQVEERPVWQNLESGCNGLDEMFGGGPEPGTACLFLGPTGVGKTTLATLYAHAAAERGLRSSLILFDERPATFLKRAGALGLDLGAHLDAGVISLREIGVGVMSPGEFAHAVQLDVEAGARLIVIDSLTGYLAAMPEERLLTAQLRELLSALSGLGVLTLLTSAQHGLAGAQRDELDVTYLADSVIQLDYFRREGYIRKSLAVLKKRYGAHGNAVRELIIDGGVDVGDVVLSTGAAET